MTNVQKQFREEKQCFSTNGVGAIGLLQFFKYLALTLTQHAKIISKYITDVNVKL